MGTSKQIEEVGMKMNGLETTKKFEFNNKKDKTEILVIKSNKRKREEEVNINLRKGKVQKTEEYKYLGDYYDRSGKNEGKIRKKMEKAKYMAHETKRMGSYGNVGNAAITVRMILLDMVVKPSLLSNAETWCNITMAEETQLTKHHHKILCIVFGQKKSTPYYGIIAETGIWPYKDVITYKKLMFLHNLTHSDDNRVAKQIVVKQHQDKDETSWYGELQEKAKGLDLDIGIKEVQKWPKSTWKKKVKEKIKIRINKDLEQETEKKTKLRFLRGKAHKKEVMDSSRCEKIMDIRLNMISAKANYRNQYTKTTCVGCFGEEETTEIPSTNRSQIDLKRGKEEMNSIEWLYKAANTIDMIEEIRSKRTQVYGS